MYLRKERRERFWTYIRAFTVYGSMEKQIEIEWGGGHRIPLSYPEARKLRNDLIRILKRTT